MLIFWLKPFHLFLITLLLLLDTNTAYGYLIGTGIGDITGPCAEIMFMGYAEIGQTGQGILSRIYARAYIIADDKDASKRVVFVNTDTQSMGEIVKKRVIQELQSVYGNDMYTDQNVMLSSTHSHSSMGGYLQYTLYELSVLGWIEETTRPMVQGIVNAIVRAHNNLQMGSINLTVGQLLNTNINRSAKSYLQNPVEERRRYKYNVDKDMTVLGLRDQKGEGVGLISWFAVHGVSINSTNHLVNGDNKGYAAYRTEKAMNPCGTLSGQGKFVAAFAQSNEGDVSPNTLGSFCFGTDIPCDGSKDDTCPTGSACSGRGPGWEISDYESNRIIGQQQADKAMDLFKQEGFQVSGVIDYRNKFFDITKMVINGTKPLCPAAMGYAFAAGTTDGPALNSLGFYQNRTEGSLLWNIIRDIIRTPTDEQSKCQAPKPILLDTGESSFPNPWQPSILEIQLFRLGEVFIASTPSELTTMSGRRLRNAIKSRLQAHGFQVENVIYSGPANGYASYCATFEEYQVQRYEGASTPYGPYTLDAYIESFYELVDAMANNESVPSLAVPDYTKNTFNLSPSDLPDHPLLLTHYGDVVKDVNTSISYSAGQTVYAVFVAGNPRNDVMLDKTYLTVEKQSQSTPCSWDVIRTDNDWDTRFRWEYVSRVLGMSKATVEWDIDHTVEAGSYRLGYFGHHRNLLSNETTRHEGYSAVFRIG